SSPTGVPTTPPSTTPPAENIGNVAKLPNGRGGWNYEAVVYSEAMGFDKAKSLAAFKTTVYTVLQAHCSGCHNTGNTLGSGAQAPIRSEVDPSSAHESALRRVTSRKREESKLVVRLAIDRHNCFGSSCKDAGTQMLAAVKAWADAVTPTLPTTPRLT